MELLLTITKRLEKSCKKRKNTKVVRKETALFYLLCYSAVMMLSWEWTYLRKQ